MTNHRQISKDLAHMDEHMNSVITALHDGNIPNVRLHLVLIQNILKKSIEREIEARRKCDHEIR